MHPRSKQLGVQTSQAGQRENDEDWHYKCDDHDWPWEGETAEPSRKVSPHSGCTKLLNTSLLADIISGNCVRVLLIADNMQKKVALGLLVLAAFSVVTQSSPSAIQQLNRLVLLFCMSSSVSVTPRCPSHKARIAQPLGKGRDGGR